MEKTIRDSLLPTPGYIDAAVVVIDSQYDPPMTKSQSILESPPTDQEEGQIPPTTAQEKGSPKGRRLLATAMGALGVVYGDIGTSPLYALRECFSEQSGIRVSEANVLGVLSLILWSLFLVISIKYLLLIMRADNRGEGGILALMSMVQSRSSRADRWQIWLTRLGLFGAALLYGDGMITPAISVLSAVEGLKAATPAFEPYVVPITVVILTGLFLFQKRGTGLVGSVFGPVILTWFLVIGGLGLVEIARTPRVLGAVSPLLALSFLGANATRGFFLLGAVFLAVTGGEALYADMGHFGKRPIRLTWFTLVLPALVLNYLGQGALLLSDLDAVQNPFYHLAPDWFLYPLVILATCATVIASQAVISGAFSLTRQAVHLGYSPRMKIGHTSREEAGQVYVGSINWALFAATLGLAIGFGSSSALAGAYGVAVATTMVITTILIYFVARNIWGWNLAAATVMAAALLTIDLAFFGANIVKIVEGGWFPLAVAAIIFTVMCTWHRGKQLLARRLSESRLPIDEFFRHLEANPPTKAKGTAIFLTGNPRGTPNALLQNVKHNQVVHERVVLLTISTRGLPYLRRSERISIEDLGRGFWRIQAAYGFMQSPRVPEIFSLASQKGLAVDISDATFFFSREIPVASRRPGMAPWRDRVFGVMARNALSVATYLDIPPDRVIEIGIPVEI